MSDFGLNDAIEARLVKTPRVVVRDDAVPDAKTYRSRLYHLYNNRDVEDDLNRKAEPQEPLPDLITNAYYLLGFDWRETAKAWTEAGFRTPPVMITVCNRTETAARVKYAFEHNRIRIPELCDASRTLHIDSKVLEEAEAQEEAVATLEAEGQDAEAGNDATPQRKRTKKEQAEFLRQQVDSVGRVGKPGEYIQSVISVGMLSEGWNARTVTHVMGLRAFTSQLLCEQVVGRGLRRTSYELQKTVDPWTGQGIELFDAEYVNIFGVPFTFLPHESEEGVIPVPPKPKTAVEPVPEKVIFEIGWPNIVRIDHVIRPRLALDWTRVQPLPINASETPRLAELAPVMEGKPDVTRISAIDLEKLAHEFRMQRIVFEAARDVYDQVQRDWKGSREFLLAQLVRLVEEFLRSERIVVTPALFNRDEIKRRLLLTLNMTRIVQHIWEAIRFENTDALEPVFDTDHPIRSTRGMGTWYTGRSCEITRKSHINVCVFDSTWEASESFALDRSSAVAAWVKNDHLGFEIVYIYRGVVRKYRPDFLIRLDSGDCLILETKGRDSEQDQTKRHFLDEWVGAVNAHDGFRRWRWDVSHDPGDLQDSLERQSGRAH